MHELGVVLYIIRDVKKVAEENHVKKVRSVTLSLGEVSGVVYEFLTDAWNWARKKHDELLDCELRIEQIDAVTYCEDCHGLYPTVQFGKTCPYCKSSHTYLHTGNEVVIKEIAVLDEEETTGKAEKEGEKPSIEDRIASGLKIEDM